MAYLQWLFNRPLKLFNRSGSNFRSAFLCLNEYGIYIKYNNVLCQKNNNNVAGVGHNRLINILRLKGYTWLVFEFDF